MVLYVISDGARLKSGRTVRLAKRLRALQPGNSASLRVVFSIEIENEAEIEQALHVRLAHCQQQGEWLKVCR